MENRILYDYVTFTSKIHDMNSVIDLLGLSGCTFEKQDNGMFGYPEHYAFNDIHIAFGAREDMGLMCSMSGKGCRAFETYGNGDYDGLFAEIIENYSEDADKRQMKLTRLDVAYDDFEHVLDIDLLLQEVLKHNFVMRFNKGSIELPFTNAEKVDSFQAESSGFNTTFKSGGMTIYFGSVLSNTRIRIYDKKAEQEREDVDHWVRCEIQLRDRNAIGFISNEEKHIGKKYFGVINNYLRFVKRNPDDSNKRRWETAEYWQKFIEYEDVISVYSKPGVDYDIHKLDSYVFGQASGAVQTMIDIIGVKRFFEKLLESRKGKKLNPKYDTLKDRMSAFSAPFREDTIPRCLGAAYAEQV